MVIMVGRNQSHARLVSIKYAVTNAVLSLIGFVLMQNA